MSSKLLLWLLSFVSSELESSSSKDERMHSEYRNTEVHCVGRVGKRTGKFTGKPLKFWAPSHSVKGQLIHDSSSVYLGLVTLS